MLLESIVMLMFATLSYWVWNKHKYEKMRVLLLSNLNNYDKLKLVLNNKTALKVIKNEDDIREKVFETLFWKNPKLLQRLCKKIGERKGFCAYVQRYEVLGIDIETIIDTDGTKKVREVGIYGVLEDKSEVKFRFDFTEDKAEWLNRFLDMVNPKVVVGHNIVNHDIPLLEKEGVKLGKYKVLDTLVLSLFAHPVLHHDLPSLSKLYGIEYVSHIPDEDARASVELAKGMLITLLKKKLLNMLIKGSYRLEKYLSGLEEFVNIVGLSHKDGARLSKSVDTIESARMEGFVTLTHSYKNSCDRGYWCPCKVNVTAVFREAFEGDLAAVLLASAVRDNICDWEAISHSVSVIDEVKKIIDESKEKYCFEPNFEQVKILNVNYLDEVIRRKLKLKGVYVERPFEILISANLKLDDLMHKLSKVTKTLIVRTQVPTLFQRFSDLFEIIKVYSHDYGGKVYGLETDVPLSKRDISLLIGYIMKIKPDYLIAEDRGFCQYIDCSSKIIVGKKKAAILDSFNISKLSNEYGIKDINYFIEFLKEVHDEVWIIRGWEELNVIPRKLKPESVGSLLAPSIFLRRSGALRQLESLVIEKWGFELRPYQKRAVLHLLQPYIKGLEYPNPLTSVILPTGAGKSVIFQSVALLINKEMGGTTIVISPLRALIEDQIESLKRRGISVCKVDGSISLDKRKRCLENARRGTVPIIYITPEQLKNDEVRKIIETLDINYVIFDEAHTITKWGLTFRPAYIYALQFFRNLRSMGKWIPIGMFSATLPESDLASLFSNLDIKDFEKLELDLYTFDINEPLPLKPRVLEGPVLRDNLTFEGMIVDWRDRVSALVKVVEHLIEWTESTFGDEPWIGIVFVPFVRSKREQENAEYVAKVLSKKLGEEVAVFHARLKESSKREILTKLYEVSRGIRKEPRILVSTKAFGMGIDIPNIRWIVHYMMSESIEDYYQEVGRAGRDQKPAKAFLLYAPHYDFERRLRLLRMQTLKQDIVIRLWDLIGTSAKVSLRELSRRLFDNKPNDEIKIVIEKALNILQMTQHIEFETEIKGGDIYYVIRKLKQELNIREVIRTLSKLSFIDFYKLKKMDELAQIIASGNEEKARKVIEEYLKMGLEDKANIIEKLFEKSEIKIVEEENSIKALVPVVSSRKKRKIIYSRALAMLILYAMLRFSISPDYSVVVVPYGFKDAVRSELKALEEKLGFTLGTIKIKVYKEKEELEVKDETVLVVVTKYRPIIKGRGEVVILEVSPSLAIKR